VDGRINYAQCDCPHFRHHKLRQGPCRHIVALSLAGGL
jgi:predicted nucleic acid-binding Zn finger protein